MVSLGEYWSNSFIITPPRKVKLDNNEIEKKIETLKKVHVCRAQNWSIILVNDRTDFWPTLCYIVSGKIANFRQNSE